MQVSRRCAVYQVIFTLGLLLAGTGITLAEVQRLPQQPVKMSIARHTFWLETASTPEEFTRGLMYRTAIPENQGMLFPFLPAKPVAFWMKNTKIPLDMIFFKNQKIVHIQHNAPPCLSDPCAIYPSPSAVDAVVELPGQTAQKLHFKVGQSAQFTPAIDSLSNLQPEKHQAN